MSPDDFMAGYVDRRPTDRARSEPARPYREMDFKVRVYGNWSADDAALFLNPKETLRLLLTQEVLTGDIEISVTCEALTVPPVQEECPF